MPRRLVVLRIYIKALVLSKTGKDANRLMKWSDPEWNPPEPDDEVLGTATMNSGLEASYGGQCCCLMWLRRARLPAQHYSECGAGSGGAP
jgi:hypothetical protein